MLLFIENGRPISIAQLQGNIECQCLNVKKRISSSQFLFITKGKIIKIG
jgi:hypothetical protein